MARGSSFKKASVLILAVLFYFPAGAANSPDDSGLSGGLQFLPASRHQQFLNFALWEEEKNGLGLRTGSTAWCALGGAVALLEKIDWPLQPQLIVFGTIDTAFRVKSTGAFDFVAETFDARFGFSVESILTPSLRFSIGLRHVSGHAGDGISDPSLFAPNLGDDIIPVRLVYDHEQKFRLGVTFLPLIGSDPTSQWFGADQFAEWFPFGASDKIAPGSPYLALGLEETGTQKLLLTYHLSMGVYFGNHFQPLVRPTLRVVVGYYHGWDPRLKYQQINQAQSSFLYTAIWVNF